MRRGSYWFKAFNEEKELPPMCILDFAVIPLG